MPRRPRNAPGGLVYHVHNRAVARLALFEKDADYQAFQRVLAEAMEKHATRLLARYGNELRLTPIPSLALSDVGLSE